MLLESLGRVRTRDLKNIPQVCLWTKSQAVFFCVEVKRDASRPQLVFLFLIAQRELVAQSCRTFCNPMDYCSLGSYVHGILQARILEAVAFSISRGSSRPRDQTWVYCIVGRFFFFYHLSHEGSRKGVEIFFFLFLFIKTLMSLGLVTMCPRLSSRV